MEINQQYFCPLLPWESTIFTQSIQMLQKHIPWVKSFILVLKSTGSNKWKWVFHSDRGKTCTKVLRRVRSATLWKFSDPKIQNPQFSPNLSKCFKNTFFELKSSVWYLNQLERTSESGFFSRSGQNLHKGAQNWEIYNYVKIFWPQKYFLQVSPDHSECSKITFYLSKATFWYLNQPDWTNGSGFFTQVRVKLEQKCSERWDLQLCENFLTPKKFSPILRPDLQGNALTNRAT